jgi:hypothetical protein
VDRLQGQPEIRKGLWVGLMSCAIPVHLFSGDSSLVIFGDISLWFCSCGLVCTLTASSRVACGLVFSPPLVTAMKHNPEIFFAASGRDSFQQALWGCYRQMWSCWQPSCHAEVRRDQKEADFWRQCWSTWSQPCWSRATVVFLPSQTHMSLLWSLALWLLTHPVTANSD